MGINTKMRMEYYHEIRPLLNSIEESGDLVFIEDNNEYYFLGVIDALGHGKEAYITSKKALDYLSEKHTHDPAHDISELHKVLKNSRGLVITLCYINRITNEMIYSGIGNITTRILGKSNKKLICKDGIVGYSISSPQNQIYELNDGEVLLAYSDGVKENIDFLEFPGLKNNSPEIIAKLLLDKYDKSTDDVSIITSKVIYD